MVPDTESLSGSVLLLVAFIVSALNCGDESANAYRKRNGAFSSWDFRGFDFILFLTFLDTTVFFFVCLVRAIIIILMMSGCSVKQSLSRKQKSTKSKGRGSGHAVFV